MQGASDNFKRSVRHPATRYPASPGPFGLRSGARPPEGGAVSSEGRCDPATGCRRLSDNYPIAAAPPLPDSRFAEPPCYALGRPCSKYTAGLLLSSGNDCFHSRTVLVAMYSLASVRLHAMQRTVLSRQVLVIDSSNFWFR